MSPRSLQARIDDMLTAATNAQSYVAGMSFEDFSQDLKTIRATAFEITILGEAAGHIPPDSRARHPEIPWALMQRMRNLIAHGYFRIDTLTVWETDQDDLPHLVLQLQGLRDELAT